jgi:hypothetical protein
MIWANKNFTGNKRRSFFIFDIQSDASISKSERLAKYELVKNEFLKYGLRESQIKMFDLNDPHSQERIVGCPSKIVVAVEPVIRKRKYRDMIFCDD